MTTIAGGLSPRGFTVQILSSPKPSFSSVKAFARAKTDRRGHYSVRKPLRRTTYFVALISFYYVTDCDPTLTASPCVSETLAPPSVGVAVARVKK